MKEMIPSDPEIYENPNYWDGHHFGDDCPWKNRGAIYQGYKTKEAESFTKRTLKDFFALTDQIPIRRFDKGKTFDAENFPPGTVIKFQREHYFISNWGFGKPKDIYFEGIYFGVICQVETKNGEKRKILKISEWDSRRNLPFSYLLMEEIVKVGEVEHTRLKAGNGFKSLEGLERINYVEVWQMGKGIPERVKERKKGLIGKLIPQRN